MTMFIFSCLSTELEFSLSFLFFLFYFFTCLLLQRNCEIAMLLIGFLHIPGVPSDMSTEVKFLPFFRLFLLNWQNSVYSWVFFISKVTVLKIFGFHCWFWFSIPHCHFPLPLCSALNFQDFPFIAMFHFPDFFLICLLTLLAFSIFQFN